MILWQIVIDSSELRDIKRHCCPTWVPPKINMEFARVSRKYSFISRRMNGRFRLKKIRSTATHIRTYHLTFCLTYMTFYLNIYSDFLSGILSGISGARCQDFTVEKQGTEADKLDRKIDSIG